LESSKEVWKTRGGLDKNLIEMGFEVVNLLELAKNKVNIIMGLRILKSRKCCRQLGF
jgi:hypothetical protein